jgi:D-sorbitol dehydrogenase-like protein
MSQQSSGPKGPNTVSRRRFMQSTALLTGLSVGGKQLVEPWPTLAQEHVADVTPAPAARAPVAPVQASPQIPAAPPISLQEFIRLSRLLTGIDKLESDLAEQYLQRCSDNEQLQPLLQDLVAALPPPQGDRKAMEKAFLDKLLLDNGRLFAGAEQIIYLWYVGGLFHPNPSGKGPGSWDYGPPDHYFRGKAWSVIGVQPPMTAHGYPYWTGV